MKTRSPRRGSMQFWPRKKSRRMYPKVHAYPASKEAKLLGFAGYKVGMLHSLIIDNRKTTQTKGTEISCPITVIECPPLKIASIRFYKKTVSGLKIVSEILAEKPDKELNRKINLPKKIKKKIEDIKEYDDIRLLVYTQPKLVGIERKKPEIFEVHIGGKKEDKLNYAKENFGKEIKVDDVFKEGAQLDIHAITKGKGFQGPVKRFGVALRSHKSEKTKRGPGSLGGWKAQGHVMYRVAHAGQMGFFKRTAQNKWLLKIGSDPKEINPKSGFNRYGLVKNQYMLLKGSIQGPKKRLIRFNSAFRPSGKFPSEPPRITFLSTNE